MTHLGLHKTGHTHICRQTHGGIPKFTPDSGLDASSLQQLFLRSAWHDPAVKSSGEDKQEMTRVKYGVGLNLNTQERSVGYSAVLNVDLNTLGR